MGRSRALRHLVLLIGVIALWTTAARAQPTPQDIDYFISNGDYLDLKISPDGKHLAALVRSGDATALVFLDAESYAVVGGAKAVRGDTIFSYRWANNERVLFELAEKFGRWEQPRSTGELYAVDIDGRRQERIFGVRAFDANNGRIKVKEQALASHRVLSTLPAEDRYILILEYPWELIGRYYRDTRNTYPVVSRLNIYNGKRRKVESLPYRGADALADTTGDVRFLHWLDDDATVHTAFRPSADDDWQPVATLSSEDDAPVLLALDGSSGKAYFEAKTGPGQHDALFEVDIQSGSATKLLGPMASNITHILWDPISNTPLGATSMPGLPQYEYLDDSHKLVKLHRGLRKAFPDQLVTITSEDRLGQQLVVRVAGDRNPGEYYLFNTETKEVRFVFANRQWMTLEDLPATTAHALTARDGLEIPILLTLPEGAEERPVPLVILSHGGPHGVRSLWLFDEEVQLLANRGYAVLQVNFRGSGGYGEAFLRAGYGEWGGAIIDDIEDAYTWLRRSYPDRFAGACAYGISFGAYASMMLAARQPEALRCVAAYAGVYDLQRLYRDGDITLLRWGDGYLESAIGRDEQQLAAYSPVNHASQIDVPVWLVHGDEDQRAPPAHARAMRDALKKQGVPVEFQMLRGGGHGIFGEEERGAYYERLLSFFDRQLQNGD